MIGSKNSSGISSPAGSVFIFGAGRVAQALGQALAAVGVNVLGLASTRPERAAVVAQATGLPCYVGVSEVSREAATVVFAVRDEAISELAATVAGDAPARRRQQVFVHCSGARSAQDAFAAVAASVAGVGLLHPLRAIHEGPNALAQMRVTHLGLGGDSVGLARVKELVSAIGARGFEVPERGMAAYHAAASMAANLLTALLSDAVELFAAAGIGEDEGREALCDLAVGAVENLREQGSPQALTGPIRRGDVETVRRHLQVLPAELAPVYLALGHRTLQLARACGDANPADLDAIDELLRGQE